MDNKKNAPREHYYKKFKETNPAEVTKRTGIKFDSTKNRFIVESLNHELNIDWPDFKLYSTGTKCPKALYEYKMEIIISRYLIEGRNVPASNQFKAYRDLPWGELYDPNFQGRCIMRFAHTFGYKVDKYKKAAHNLGGTPIKQSDAGYDYTFLPGIICRLLLWTPDEEFPPSAQFLFSDNIQFALNAEDLAVVGDIIIEALSDVGDAALGVPQNAKNT